MAVLTFMYEMIILLSDMQKYIKRVADMNETNKSGVLMVFYEQW